MAGVTRWLAGIVSVVLLAACGSAPGGAYEVYPGPEPEPVYVAQVCVDTATGLRVEDGRCPTDPDVDLSDLAPYVFYYFASTVLVPAIGASAAAGSRTRPPSVSLYRAPAQGVKPGTAPPVKVLPPRPAPPAVKAPAPAPVAPRPAAPPARPR